MNSKIIVNPRVTTYLYLLILLCYAFCHIDNGIIAVSNETIKKSLNITESEVGLIATGLYIGNVAGSIVTPLIFAKLNTKLIIVVSAIFNALAVSVFALVTNYWVIFSSRILVGFFQVMFVIYFPVWIDICAPPEKQTMWISFFFLTVPIGIILGYGLTVFFTTFTDYQYTFLVQTALMLVPISLLFAIIPARYYQKSEQATQNNDYGNQSAPIIE